MNSDESTELDQVNCTIDKLQPSDAVSIRALLSELAWDEQRHYAHPQRTRTQIESDVDVPKAEFTGENHVFVARDRTETVVALCWCVLFDPGTGLEGEVAELYVAEQCRGQKLAQRLLAEAVQLFRLRNVTFACVWTRPDNAAALAAYRAAGFEPTEQTVLTWLPLPGR